jgi:hypothetical protein
MYRRKGYNPSSGTFMIGVRLSGAVMEVIPAWAPFSVSAQMTWSAAGFRTRIKDEGVIDPFFGGAALGA